MNFKLTVKTPIPADLLVDLVGALAPITSGTSGVTGLTLSCRYTELIVEGKILWAEQRAGEGQHGEDWPDYEDRTYVDGEPAEDWRDEPTGEPSDPDYDEDPEPSEPDDPDLTCPECGKVCGSAAGLGSHRRSHGRKGKATNPQVNEKPRPKGRPAKPADPEKGAALDALSEGLGPIGKTPKTAAQIARGANPEEN